MGEKPKSHVERKIEAQKRFIEENKRYQLPALKNKIDKELTERGMSLPEKVSRPSKEKSIASYVQDETRQSQKALYNINQPNDFYQIIPVMNNTISSIDDRAKRIETAISMEMLGLRNGLLDKLKFHVMRFYNKDLESPQLLLQGQLDDIDNTRDQIEKYHDFMQAKQEQLKLKFLDKMREIATDKLEIKELKKKDYTKIKNWLKRSQK